MSGSYQLPIQRPESTPVLNRWVCFRSTQTKDVSPHRNNRRDVPLADIRPQPFNSRCGISFMNGRPETRQRGHRPQQPRFIDTARPKEHEADDTKTSCSTAEKRGSRGRLEAKFATTGCLGHPHCRRSQSCRYTGRRSPSVVSIWYPRNLVRDQLSEYHRDSNSRDLALGRHCTSLPPS